MYRPEDSKHHHARQNVLLQKNVYVDVTRGYGVYDNVASNTETSKNRRVEVWIQ